MRLTFQRTAIAALFLAAATSPAQADIIISTDQGAIQPTLVHYNSTDCGVLANNAMTVQGCVNDTENTLIDISSDIVLTADGGQARIERFDTTDVFDLAFIRPNDTSLGFEEFESNMTIVASTPGTATIEACNQFGSFGGATQYTPSGPFGDGLACESFTFAINTGENFFVVYVGDTTQLLRGVRITTTVGLLDLRQIRIGGFEEFGDDVVLPEPASMALFATALAGFAARRRRRR